MRFVITRIDDFALEYFIFKENSEVYFKNIRIAPNGAHYIKYRVRFDIIKSKF